MLMQGMTMVQQTTLYHVAARHGGDTWQIILGAALSIQSFTMIPLWGAGQGFQPAAGTNYGAKQYDRVKQVTRDFTQWLIGAGIDPETAEQDACRMEHGISQKSFELLRNAYSTTQNN